MNISIKEAFDFGWIKFKENWLFLMSVTLFAALIVPILFVALGFGFNVNWILFGKGAGAAGNTNYKLFQGLINICVPIASFMMSTFLLLGLIRISLKYCDNGKPLFEDLFSC
ncbi:MAG: hypothetical protein ABIA63_01505, partial [bacterium]